MGHALKNFLKSSLALPRIQFETSINKEVSVISESNL